MFQRFVPLNHRDHATRYARETYNIISKLLLYILKKRKKKKNTKRSTNSNGFQQFAFSYNEKFK